MSLHGAVCQWWRRHACLATHCAWKSAWSVSCSSRDSSVSTVESSSNQWHRVVAVLRLCDSEIWVRDWSGVLLHRTDHCATEAQQIVSPGARMFQLFEKVQSLDPLRRGGIDMLALAFHLEMQIIKLSWTLISETHTHTVEDCQLVRTYSTSWQNCGFSFL